MRRRQFLAAITAATGAAALAASARAATEAAFTQAAFAAAQREGKPILVHVNASWCPTCAKQRPILSNLFSQPAYRELVVFQMDFDSQKDAVRELGVRMQSTLVAFHGATEKARSTGETDPAKIAAVVGQAMA